MSEITIMEGIVFLVGGGVGSLVTAVGVTRTMISKSDCGLKHKLTDKVIETKLDSITETLSEVKEHQNMLYRDFYKLRIRSG